MGTKKTDRRDLRILQPDRRSFLRSVAATAGGVAAGATTLAGAAEAQPPRRPGPGRRPPGPPRPPVRPPGDRPEALSLVGDVPTVQVITKTGTRLPEPPKLKRDKRERLPSTRQRLLRAIAQTKEGPELLEELGIESEAGRPPGDEPQYALSTEGLEMSTKWALGMAYAEGITLNRIGCQFAEGIPPISGEPLSYYSFSAYLSAPEVLSRDCFILNVDFPDNVPFLTFTIETPGGADAYATYMIELYVEGLQLDWFRAEMDYNEVDFYTTSDDTFLALAELSGTPEGHHDHELCLHKTEAYAAGRFRWFSVTTA